MSDGGIHKVIKIMAVAILLPLGIVIPTLSLDSYYAEHTQAQAQNDESFLARKKAYREALKEEVSSSVQERVKLRCLAVQAHLKRLSRRMGNAKTQRENAYDNIVNRLNKLATRLKAHDIDVTDLQARVTNLSEEVDEFKSEIADYRQALDDLALIDCSKDPTSFIAALEAARGHQAKLIGIVADIRSDIINTIKPTLEQLRKELIKQHKEQEKDDHATE